jgi:sphingosine kinase
MKDGTLQGVGMEDEGSYAAPSLEETFYILSKKNTVYRVKLSEKGLCMQKESNGTVKTETISLSDIVGCRCMRSRRGRSDQSCTSWTPSNKRKYSPRVVEEHSLERDESDTSAYLYIYAYVLKKSKVKSHKKRDRVVITLRFRSYDRYDDNIKEAHKWKVTIKFLLQTHLSPSLPSCFFRTTNQNLGNVYIYNSYETFA